MMDDKDSVYYYNDSSNYRAANPLAPKAPDDKTESPAGNQTANNHEKNRSKKRLLIHYYFGICSCIRYARTGNLQPRQKKYVHTTR